MGNDVILLLLGANEGAYALASSFAGDYGIPVCVMDERIPIAFSASSFVRETRTVSGLAYRGLFMRALCDFYEAHPGKSILLISTTADYTARVLEEREELERMFLLPQKKCPERENFDGVPAAMLLLYVGRTGDVRTVYGEIAARTEEGTPLAVITKPTPKALLAHLHTDTPHFALYLIGEDGHPFHAGEKYADFLAFSSAADLSLAEWILTDYVTCESIGEDGSIPTGLFTLFSYKKTKSYILFEQKELVKTLRRKRLSVRLYAEKRRPLRRAYRENWEKITKTKK